MKCFYPSSTLWTYATAKRGLPLRGPTFPSFDHLARYRQQPCHVFLLGPRSEDLDEIESSTINGITLHTRWKHRRKIRADETTAPGICVRHRGRSWVHRAPLIGYGRARISSNFISTPLRFPSIIFVIERSTKSYLSS